MISRTCTGKRDRWNGSRSRRHVPSIFPARSPSPRRRIMIHDRLDSEAQRGRLVKSVSHHHGPNDIHSMPIPLHTYVRYYGTRTLAQRGMCISNTIHISTASPKYDSPLDCPEICSPRSLLGVQLNFPTKCSCTNNFGEGEGNGGDTVRLLVLQLLSHSEGLRLRPGTVSLR